MNKTELSNLLTRLNFILLACVAATLPFNVSFSFTSIKLNNMFIVLTAVNSLFLFVLSKPKPKGGLTMILYLLTGFYFLHALSLLQTQNAAQGLFELEKKAGLALFPLIFYFTPSLSAVQVRKILLAFCVSCVLTALACILVAGYRYLSIGTTEYFSYHNLSGIAGMHAVYLSMYCCFTIAIIVYFASAAPVMTWRRKLLASLVIVFLATIIFLLAGRIHIFLLVLGIMSYSVYCFRRGNSLAMSFLKAGVIGIVVVGIALLFPTSRERFKQAINYKGQYGLDREWGEQQMRPLIWTCAWEEIKNAPIFGTGAGDVQDDLQACYVENDFVSLLIWEPLRFNAHNQFLEVTVGLGLTGFLFFLAILAICYAHAVRNNNKLYLIFLIIITVSFITESMLQKHQGIIFFSLFNGLLLFHSDKLPKAFSIRKSGER